MRPPLNGTKTHPLTTYGWEALGMLARGPQPRHIINAGVVNRLDRESLVEEVELPSPYATHKGRNITHLQLTEGHGISDLTPLAACPVLVDLNLTRAFSLSDLGPLSS